MEGGGMGGDFILSSCLRFFWMFCCTQVGHCHLKWVGERGPKNKSFWINIDKSGELWVENRKQQKIYLCFSETDIITISTIFIHYVDIELLKSITTYIMTQIPLAIIYW